MDITQEDLRKSGEVIYYSMFKEKLPDSIKFYLNTVSDSAAKLEFDYEDFLNIENMHLDVIDVAKDINIQVSRKVLLFYQLKYDSGKMILQLEDSLKHELAHLYLLLHKLPFDDKSRLFKQFSRKYSFTLRDTEYSYSEFKSLCNKRITKLKE